MSDQRLSHYYLDVERGPGAVQRTIHPEDEMLSFLTGEGRLFRYFRTACVLERCLDHALRSTGRRIATAGRVLEFAAGYGRLTRLLVTHPGTVTTCDILPGAVEFSRETFGVHAVRSTTDPDEVTLEPADLIVVVSLFSHLPWARFEAWFRRLCATLTDRGLLVFSTHGAALGPAPDQPFAFVPMSESGTLNPQEYGSAYVTPARVAELARDVGVAHNCVERDIEGFQDLHLVARSHEDAPRDWSRTPVVEGRIDALTSNGSQFALEGWAADTRDGAPIEAVELLLGHDVVGRAVLGGKRDDVAASAKREDWRASGWSFHGDATSLPAGRHLVAARARSGDDASVFDVAEVERMGDGRVTLRATGWGHA